MATSNSYYRGIRGIHLIWHGEWADPELSYKGKVVNYYAVEDTIWEEYKEDRKTKGLLVVDDASEFSKYCQQHAAEIKQLILDIWTGSRK